MNTRHADTLRLYINNELAPLERLETLLPDRTDSSELLVACAPEHYSASAIAKAVEDCDVQLLALSVTGMRDSQGRPVISLTVNARTPDGIARSLERYGCEVIHTRGDLSPRAQSEAIARVNELLHYLEL